MSLADELKKLASARVPGSTGAHAHVVSEPASTRERGATSAQVRAIVTPNGSRYEFDEQGAQVHESTGLRGDGSAGARVPVALDEAGKRSHPDFKAVKVLVRKDTHKRAKRAAEDAGYPDFSDLVEELLQDWLNHGRASARVPGSAGAQHG